MSWAMIFGALMSIFGPLISDAIKRWLERRLNEAAKALGVSASTYGSVHEARNALFDKAVDMTRNPFKRRLLRRMQLRAAEADIGAENARPLSEAAKNDIVSASAVGDSREQEVITKVKALVDDHFRGSYRAAFDAYDVNGDGKISTPEVVELLYDAQIANRLTRWQWAKTVVSTLDKDADGNVAWEEFERHLVSE